MGDDMNEAIQFVTDEVSLIIREVAESVLGTLEFSNELVKPWTATILDRTMTGLIAMQKPFKYTVNCAIMQKTGAGLHTVSSCNWDIGVDSCVSVRWENKFTLAIVSVFALSL